jgi:hypothetical protein
MPASLVLQCFRVFPAVAFNQQADAVSTARLYTGDRTPGTTACSGSTLTCRVARRNVSRAGLPNGCSHAAMSLFIWTSKAMARLP